MTYIGVANKPGTSLIPALKYFKVLDSRIDKGIFDQIKLENLETLCLKRNSHYEKFNQMLLDKVFKLNNL